MDDFRPLVRIRRLVESGEAQTIREKAHLTRAEMATAVGVCHESLWRYEKGHRSPRGSIALRYLAVLNTLREEVAQ